MKIHFEDMIELVESHKLDHCNHRVLKNVELYSWNFLVKFEMIVSVSLVFVKNLKFRRNRLVRKTCSGDLGNTNLISKYVLGPFYKIPPFFFQKSSKLRPTESFFREKINISIY